MKIAEQLAETKRNEAELYRLYEERTTLVAQSFENTLINKDIPQDDIKKLEEKFLQEQYDSIFEINSKIEKLKTIIIEAKNLINKKNVEMGIDKKLLEIKYVRTELAKTMKLLDHYTMRNNATKKLVKKLDIDTRIKTLEKQKARLDAEIQQHNWNTNL